MFYNSFYNLNITFAIFVPYLYFYLLNIYLMDHFSNPNWFLSHNIHGILSLMYDLHVFLKFMDINLGILKMFVYDLWQIVSYQVEEKFEMVLWV